MNRSGKIFPLQERLDYLREKLLLTGNSADNVKGEALEIIDELQTITRKINQIIETGKNGTDEKYKLIFDNVPAGILQYNEKGVITDCNSNFIEILGSSRKKVIGLDMTLLPNKVLVSAVEKSLTGKPGYFEGNYTSVTGNKSSRGRALFSPVFDVNQKIMGGVGIIEDISERYNSEKALHESESRYRNIFENNYIVMMLIDPEDGSIVDVNEAALNYYGWTRPQFLKKNIRDINTINSVELKKELEIARSGKQNIFHYKHRLADGSIRDVEILRGNIPFKGKNMLFSIVHDITARIKASEELRKFRLGIDRTSSSIFITDAEGKIEYVNPAFEDLYGYSFEEVNKRNPRILQSGKQSEEFYEDFWETILSGNVARGEIINKTKNGELLNIYFSSNPIVNNEGKIIGFIAIQNNITNYKKLEENLRESIYEKEIMLAEIHHRVKNNLAMVSAMMTLQAGKADNTVLSDKLLDSTNRIKAIANIHEHLYQSSNFSQVNFTKNILSLITEIVNTLRTDTEISTSDCGDGIHLNLNQAVYCSMIVNEVVTNIIKHAFTNRKKGEISVCTKVNNDKAVIEITDNGNELPPDFQNSDSDTLGMELIHILTRQLNGTFEYKTSKEGTTFSLFFKKKEENDLQFTVEEKMQQIS